MTFIKSNIISRINKYILVDNEFKKLFFIVFLVTIFFASYPLLNDKFILGDDITYHLWRIENLKSGLLSGQFPVRIGPIFLNGYGYASSLFYPDLFLYIPAILRIMGVSVEISYKIFIILCISATYISTYITVKYISQNRTSAICSSILFVLSQYFLVNIYSRAALGEIQAYIFIPLVVLGIYDLVFKDFEKNYVMGIGFIGLMFTHSISLLIMLLITTIIVLFNFKKVLLNKKKLKKLILTAVVVLLITSCFWVPLFEQISSGKFKYQVPWVKISSRAVWPSNLISIAHRSIGLNIFILSLMRISISDKNTKVLDWFLGIGFIIVLVCTKVFPWSLFDNTFINSIQFPWRLFTEATLFLCIAIGIMAMIVGRKIGDKKIITLILMLSCSYTTLVYEARDISRESVDIPKNYSEVEKGIIHVGRGAEWLPVEVENPNDLLKSKKVISNLGDSIEYSEDGINLEFENTGIYKYFDVPRVYYKGYLASLYNNENIDLNIEKLDKNGLIRIYVPKGKSGTIKLSYKGTKLQHMTMFISIVSMIVVIYIYFKKKYKLSHD